MTGPREGVTGSRAMRFHCSFRAAGMTADSDHALSSKKLLNEVTLPLLALQ
jgi:hypothetical protein